MVAELERPTSYPPAAPGPGAVVWKCRCGQPLGVVYAGWLYSRHRGRSIEAGLPARVQCESCGRKNARGLLDSNSAIE